MIPPDRATIDLYAGTDDSFEWEWVADGVGVDFSGCTATFSLFSVPGTTPLLTVSTTAGPSGGIQLGTFASEMAGRLARGQVLLTILAAATSAMTTAASHGDLVITMSDGTQQEFLAIDANFHGPLFLGTPGPSGGIAAPAGPPGLPGPGPGRTISSPVPYLVLASDYWLRADLRANNVTFELGVAKGDGDSRTFTVEQGAGGAFNAIVASTTGVNLKGPQAPWPLLQQYAFNGGSVTFTWSSTTSEWIGQ